MRRDGPSVYASHPMPSTSQAGRGDQAQPRAVDFTCPSCRATIHHEEPGKVKRCSSCRERMGKIAQLDQLLAKWYEPRRWRADLVRPSVAFLIERLWTANGQGERLYEGVSPKYTNYDIFRNLVTRLIIQGVDEGWAELSVPADPLAEDPQYELKIVDSERFARGVEKLFPEVDWDEPVQPAESAATPPAAT